MAEPAVGETSNNTGATEVSGSIPNKKVDKKLPSDGSKKRRKRKHESLMVVQDQSGSTSEEAGLQPKKPRRKAHGQNKRRAAMKYYIVKDNLEEEALSSPKKSNKKKQKKRKIQVQGSSRSDESPIGNPRRSSRKTERISYEEQDEGMDLELIAELEAAVARESLIELTNETWNGIYALEPLNRTPRVEWKNPSVRLFDKTKAVEDVANGPNFDILLVDTPNSTLSENHHFEPAASPNYEQVNAMVED
ncbi:hypothetical protein CAEBREN_13412 [Caenorhabditis brenneri]|uniref:Uncharacterized protein n=1 Tax=Caenorhabditis brenneri TaxID=135651 RepID=G0PDY6_CAEBE|nr:hypothetical protein CAEBREN_13412 [Caenorhabditis brenneri]